MAREPPGKPRRTVPAQTGLSGHSRAEEVRYHDQSRSPSTRPFHRARLPRRIADMTHANWLRLLFLVPLLLLGGNASAQGATEYRIKAAMLYNLARLMEWPTEGVETANEPFPLCFIGENVFGDSLNFIEGKKVRGRSLTFRRDVERDDLASCMVLFIPESEETRLEDILHAVHALPLLTVGDAPGFAQRGAVINFSMDAKKVQLELNAQAAERAGLTLSPTLLRLAKSVDDHYQPAPEETFQEAEEEAE